MPRITELVVAELTFISIQTPCSITLVFCTQSVENKDYRRKKREREKSVRHNRIRKTEGKEEESNPFFSLPTPN